MSTDLNMEYQEVKFGDICREVKLTTKDPIADGYDKYIGLEHLDSGSLKIKRWGLIAEDNPTFTRVFKKGHILFGKRRPYLHKAAIAEFDGVCSADILVFDYKKHSCFEEELWPYIFLHEKLWDKAIESSAGSLSPRTKFSALKDLSFFLPHNNRQLEILELIKKLNKLILLIEDSSVKLNTLNDQCYKASFSSTNMKKIMEICTVKTGSTPSRAKPNYWIDGKINWMSSGEIHQKSVIFTQEKITEAGLKNSNTTLFPKHTVMIAMNGQGKTRGTVAITEIETTCNQSLAALLVNTKLIDPFYLFYYLDGQYTNIRNLTGEGRNGLNLKLVGNIEIPMVALEKQKNICNVFNGINKTKQMLNKKKENVYKLMVSSIFDNIL